MVLDDGIPEPASSVRAIASVERAPESSRVRQSLPHHLAEHLLPYAQQIANEHPGYFDLLGTTPVDYAANMAEPGRTLEESVAAGLMSAAEARFVAGSATREDLVDLGYAPVEIDAILEVTAVRPIWSEHR